MYKPIFKFLGYVSPVWYFNLKPNLDHGYFPTKHQVDNLPDHVIEDNGYHSQEARALDFAWNAFQAGCISKSTGPGKNIWNSDGIPIEDEYRFLRKNFHPVWSLYVLFLRVLSLHNPYREFVAYWKNRGVKRIFHTPVSYHDYESYTSALVERRPLVSVVIPTLNRYSWLNDVLNDLAVQTYQNFEVIVVDQSQPFQEDFYKNRNLSLTVWYQQEKALWKARNDAIQSSKGELILLYDDDSRVEQDWITQHLKALDYFNADISSGVSISTVGAKVPAHYAHFRWSDQLDTGNVLVKREVFRQIGLFDRQFEKQRMGDGEFGLRAYLAGFRNVSNPKAIRLHLKVDKGGLRQMGSWDGWRPKSLLAPRPVPSVLYLFRKYFGNKVAMVTLVNLTIPSLVPYSMKRNKFLYFFMLIFLPFILPLAVIQVGRSWYLSGIKLNEGSRIEFLK